jgi:hypothetical protein
MTNQHPITPPPELVQQWYQEADSQLRPYYVYIAIRAAQWGADQELQACCTAIDEVPGGWADSRHLRHVRRPKTPSLKEQALADLNTMTIEPCWINGIDTNAPVRAKYDTIRRALEALND